VPSASTSEPSHATLCRPKPRCSTCASARNLPKSDRRRCGGSVGAATQHAPDAMRFATRSATGNTQQSTQQSTQRLGRSRTQRRRTLRARARNRQGCLGHAGTPAVTNR
jgi:hypothetical protein